MNPGPWTAHSLYAAEAGERIADSCRLDAGKTVVCGLLHDIGRRSGVSDMLHVIDGYNYVVSKGWRELARVCLTHSFPVRDVDAGIGKKDITPEQYAFIREYLNGLEYDDYDKLIILCEALADARGFCILEKRFIDTARRYGVFPFSADRWNWTYEYKEHLEALAGRPLYSLLPGIERCLYWCFLAPADGKRKNGSVLFGDFL